MPRGIWLWVALLGIGPVASTTAGDMRAPADRLCPEVRAAQGVRPTGNHAVVATWASQFYRTCVHPARGGRCPMSPSCSHYSQAAFAKHGPLIGLWATADRLMRCGADANLYRPGFTERGLCRLDPVP